MPWAEFLRFLRRQFCNLYDVKKVRNTEAKGELIIAEELKRLGWQETGFAMRRKHDPGKVQIALRLRKETTLSVKQIAERIDFGTSKSASFRLLTTNKRENCSKPAQGTLR